MRARAARGLLRSAGAQLSQGGGPVRSGQSRRRGPAVSVVSSGAGEMLKAQYPDVYRPFFFFFFWLD